jgi:hypothetical protein
MQCLNFSGVIPWTPVKEGREWIRDGKEKTSERGLGRRRGRAISPMRTKILRMGLQGRGLRIGEAAVVFGDRPNTDRWYSTAPRLTPTFWALIMSAGHTKVRMKRI